MKTIFIFLLLLGLSSQLISQNKSTYNIYSKKINKVDYSKKTILHLPINNSNLKSKSLNTILIGNSYNARTVLYEPNYQLDANSSINTIIFIHNAGGPWGGANSDLRCKISYDFGQTWNDSIIFPYQIINSESHFYRSPNVILYNPTGNSTPNNAYVLINGPISNGINNNYSYFDSKKLDGTNSAINHFPCINNKQERINLSGGNGLFHTMTDSIDSNNSSHNGVLIRNINFNNSTNNFDVDSSLIFIKRGIALDSNNIDTINTGINWNNIFDESGMHGYVYCLGYENNHDPYNKTQLPLVNETWDGGNTWNSYFASGEWHNLSNLTDYIWPTSSGQYRPYFQGGTIKDENFMPSVIDYQGNLHILTTIMGMASNHPDSLYYAYANQPTLLFDVYTTGYDGNGGYKWDVQIIDTLQTQVMLDEWSNFTSGTEAFGWNHMLNIATSPDKKIIFAIWTDTSPLFDTVNTIPEIKCRAFDIETMMSTPVINFTQDEWGMFFFINVPHTVLKNGNDYIIPLTYMDIYETLNPLQWQNHYFLKDLRVTLNDFSVQLRPSNTYIHENNINESLFVAQNNPNPAKNNTEIAVTLSENSNLDIVITNMMGQHVMEINKGMLTSGKHNISINTSSLSSGIYFYTVTANNNSVTKKMVIE